MLNPNEWLLKSPEQQTLCKLTQSELLKLGYKYSVYQFVKSSKLANGQHYYNFKNSREVLTGSRVLFKKKSQALEYIDHNRNVYGSILCSVRSNHDLGMEEV